ncbi:MAG: S41 family peptidase [Clostridium sp.]|nr:S41 family peptidase [Clostridium sp.]
MKITKSIIIALMLPPLLQACHSIEEWDNDAKGNFEACWRLVDEHYCFFSEKDVDWDEVHDRYSQRLYDGMTSKVLFQVCSDMLGELRDGHVNLSAWFDTYYYTNWWSDYPQNYDSRLVEQYYLGFDCYRLGGVKYAILPQNIGYISYPSFQYGLGESNLDAILSAFRTCTGIIIDVRDNGGGNLTYSEDLTRRFMSERTLAGYFVTKTGPGHADFSKPDPFYYAPPAEPHLLWAKPVAVLTNRSTFSAANNFVAVMRYLPQVIIVGARTGGGSGMPINMELPCGWNMRMSALSILDAKGLVTESGIDPTEGCEVALDPQQALLGRDTMIDFAIQKLNSL